MPAVTVSDLSKLPPVPALDRGSALERPVKSVTTAPQGLEGEGFPVRRAFAGVHLQDLDPFVHMDQMGEVRLRPRGTEGDAVAPPSRVRDRHLHDGRDLRPPGLARRRRPHHGRGHAVDDGGEGDSAHRDAAGGARRLRGPVPRHPAVGEPARPGQDDRARLPGTRSGRRDAARVGRRRRAGAHHRRRRRRSPRPRVDPHADGVHARIGGARCAPRAAVGPRVQRAGLSPVGIGPGGRRRSAGDERATRHVRAGRLPLGPGGRRAGVGDAATSRCCSSVASRSGSRWSTTGPS